MHLPKCLGSAFRWKAEGSTSTLLLQLGVSSVVATPTELNG